MQDHRLGLGRPPCCVQATESHVMPAALSLLKLWQLTLPLQGLGQAHPIQHLGQLPTTPAVGPPHSECRRAGRLVGVPAPGVRSCARLHLAGGVTLEESRSQEACSEMRESAYRARDAVQASLWGPWHRADLKLKPGGGNSHRPECLENTEAETKC